MASVRARLIVLWLRWRVKRRLMRVTSVAQARAGMNAMARAAPRDVDARPGAVGGIDGEWVRRRGADPAAGPILLYLHGGGYFACSPATHRPITAAFARAGFRVFAPAYRLAPEHPFPAALDDAVAAFAGLRGAGDGGAIVLAGDSAGGGLALALLVALRDRGIAGPAAAALFSPWTDLAATGASLQENARRDAFFDGDAVARGADVYLAGADPRDPRASPLHADLHDLPPLLFQVGADEVLRDDSIRAAARARAAGVMVEITVVPVVPHVWQIMHAFLPEGRRSLAEASRFLQAHAGTGSGGAAVPARGR